jgi:glycerophosphoryl diester phosphodiesterase
MKVGILKSLFISSALLIGPFLAQVEASQCIAHRGVHYDYVENSLLSLREAHLLGIDGVEFDIRHTLDGTPILMHDKTLERTSISRPGKNCRLKIELSEQLWFEIKENCQLKDGQEIPHLQEALRELENKSTIAFIEFKDEPTILSYQLFNQYLAQESWRFRFISFKRKVLDQLSTMGRYLPSLSHIKMLHVDPLYLKPWTDHGVNIRFGKWAVRRMQKLIGRETGVWTVNEEKKIQYALDHGVSFVTTNDPKLCMELK